MKKDNQDASRYSELGVSASKQGLHDALQRAGVESSAGFFAQLGPDIAGDPAVIEAYLGIDHGNETTGQIR